MKLWLISQTENNGYDTFDSAVVVAATAGEAQRIHPSEYGKGWSDNYPTWASKPENVTVELIGDAVDGVEGVICASFNAG